MGLLCCGQDIPTGTLVLAGAHGDGVHDDYAVIQSFVDRMCGLTAAAPGAQGASLRIPAAKSAYAISKPIVLTCPNSYVYGDGLASRIKALYGYGPTLVTHPPIGHGYIAFPTATSLVTHDGHSMVLDSSGHYFLNLRDAIDLDGLSQITVEFTTRLTRVDHDGAWISSLGRRTIHEALTSAVTISMTKGGHLGASLNVGGTDYRLDAPIALRSEVLYHIALTYDGSRIRLFLNGQLQASAPATGRIQEALTEDITVGPSVSGWPEGALLWHSVDGILESIRISTISRYNDNFNPPSVKPATDRNTLIVLNFDRVYDAFTIASVAGREAHLFLRYSAPHQGFLSDIRLSGLTFDNNVNHNCGPILVRTVGSKVDNIEVRGGRFGLFLENNDYEDTISNYVFRTATFSRWSLAVSNASGVVYIDRPLLFGGIYQLIISGDESVSVKAAWFQTEANTVVALLSSGGGSPVSQSLDSSIFNTESGGISIEALTLIANVIGDMDFISDYFEAPRSKPAIKVEGGGQLNIIGGVLAGGETALSSITVPVNPLSPLIIIGTTRTQTHTPLTDNPSFTSVLSGSVLDKSSLGRALRRCDCMPPRRAELN